MHDQSLQEMYRHRTFLRGMDGRNPGAMRPDPSAPIALPPRRLPAHLGPPRLLPPLGRPLPAPMPQPGGQQGARPIQASLRDVAMGFAGPAGMAGRAAGVGFAAFLQKYPSVGRLFGR